MKNSMKILPVGNEYVACGKTDNHDKANYRFLQLCEHACKLKMGNKKERSI